MDNTNKTKKSRKGRDKSLKQFFTFSVTVIEMDLNVISRGACISRTYLNPMTRSMISTSVSSTECRISPVCRGYARLVLLGAGLVEHRQQLRRLVSQRLQIHHCIRPVSIIGVEDEVSVEVSGVESRQGQTIAVPSQRSFGGSHGGSGSCGEQVVKEMISDVSRYSTSLKQNILDHQISETTRV